MTNPEPGGPSQPGRRDWMLSGVDGATVMLWAVTGNFWWVLLASAWGALAILQRHPPTPPR
jgi:hypothetical protein